MMKMCGPCGCHIFQADQEWQFSSAGGNVLEFWWVWKLRYSPQSSAATDAWNLATEGEPCVAVNLGKSTAETHENSSGAQLFIDVLHILQMVMNQVLNRCGWQLEISQGPHRGGVRGIAFEARTTWPFNSYSAFAASTWQNQSEIECCFSMCL